jgi:hypothetical protein
MTRNARALTGLLLTGLLAGGGIALLKSGLYGWTTFVLVPLLLGGIASWTFRAESGAQAAGIGALGAVAAACLLLFLGAEGLICITMALPLVVPLGALGGWIAYLVARTASRTRGIAMLLMLPLPPSSILWDVEARPPVFAVRTTIEIAAPAQRVWKHVVTYSELPAPREWFFHAGVAYPTRARIDGSGIGGTRYCQFTTGQLVEPIEVWDEPRLMRFRVTQNPAPMREWSPYGELTPKHLNGYLVSEHGQFRLIPLPNGHTLLEATTWYRHGLWPAEYWRWWSDAIIHRIHLLVITHIRALSENDLSAPCAELHANCDSRP